jgi:putative DNA primase/helicase
MASPSSQPSQGPNPPSSDTARDNKSFIKNVVLETSYGNVNKCVSKYVFKDYSIVIEDLGNCYKLEVFRVSSNELLPTFLVSKKELERELIEYTKLPPPNNLDVELVQLLLNILKPDQDKATKSNEVKEEVTVNESLNQPVSEVRTANESKQQLGSEVKEEVILPEELNELVEDRKARLLIPKIASIIVNHLINMYHIKTPVVNDSVLGIYCYEGGAYIECEEKLESLLKEYYSLYGLDEKGIKYKPLRTEFLAQLEDSTKVFRGFNHHLLLFKNKVVDWKSLVYEDKLVIYDPNPDLMIYHKIPWEVDVDVLTKGLGKTKEELVRELESDVKEVTDIFKDWVGDKWLLLYEIIGYTLLAGEYPLNKAIMLVSEGRNGKSTYLELIKRLLGSDNVVSIKLQDLTNDKSRFMINYLYGKMANVFADLPSEALRNTGLFKVLTGEDTVTADRKFRDPITFVNYAKMLFSCNELPKVYDMTTAYWRRWLVIEFPKQFPPNEEFKKKLYNELLPKYAAKILAYSLLLIRYVIKSGKFDFEGSEVDYKEIWLRETNSVYAFIQDMVKEGVLVKDPEGRVETSELYRLYVKYCEKEEREALAKNQFTVELQRLGYPKVPYKGYYYYKGLRLKRELEGSEGVNRLEEYMRD